MPTTPKVSVGVALVAAFLAAFTGTIAKVDGQVIAPAEAGPPPGAGSLYIDHDGDGYGPASPMGPDADDADALVNTPDTVKAKYGDDISPLLAKQGYRPRRIFYIAPAGRDATGQADAPAKPYATFAAVVGSLRAGDAVLFMGGTYKGKYPMVCQKVQGSDDQPIVVAAYPGQRVVIDAEGLALALGNCRNLVFDGLTLTSSATSSSAGVSMHFCSRIVLRRIEACGHKWGIHGMQDLHEILIEDCVLHNNPVEHGVYLGCREAPNSRLTMRNCLSYRNGRHGFQHNGRVTELLLENNSFHTNALGGISFINGVSSSIVRDNLIFNNNKQGIVMYTYTDPNPQIVPYSQNGNLFERNTIWIGQRGWNGQYEPVDFPAVVFNDSTTAQTIQMSENIFRDNVIVTQRGPVFSFKQRRFAAVTGIENNTLFRIAGPAMCVESVPQTLAYAAIASLGNRVQGNVYEDPKFRDVSPSYFATPEKFDFSRGGGSVAVHNVVVQPLAAAVPVEAVAIPPAAVRRVAPQLTVAAGAGAAVTGVSSGAGSRNGAGVLYWDNDGDGYGPASPLGPDASDANAALNTPDTVTAKYGQDVRALLAAQGYRPQRIFFLSPAGSDDNGQVDDASAPYATFAAVRRDLKAGDAVLFREGTYAGKYPLILRGLIGTAEAPILIAAYPGHRAVIEGQLACAVLDRCHFVTLDGLTLVGAGSASTSAGVDLNACGQIALRNLDSHANKWGLRGQEDLHDILIEHCVFHDNTAEGLYLGSRVLPNSRVTVRICLAYRNGASGLHNDGRVSELLLQRNVIHTNTGEGILLSNGVSQSAATDNLIFNNTRQGIALSAGGVGSQKVVAYDQTANVFERNTIWIGRQSWQEGSEPKTAAAVQINDMTVEQKVRMNDNVFRNNVLVTSEGPSLSLRQKRFAADIAFENNTLFRSAGPDFVMEYGPQNVSFKLMSGLGPRIRGNRFEEPQFADVSADYFARPEKFDFSPPAAAAAVKP
ncbi:MAG: right-handed parallel beta-helix repeat-containing protein [Planctomycetaceae bacterium]|nr:right-handed parallel beta-helix repeat-containing protein [Planctomycetaceae bacterium]